MAFKVTKNYGKYSIVKDDYYEKWYIVDVEHGYTLTGGYYLKSLKWQAEALESGAKKPEDFESKWNYDYLNPLDMPKSLKAKQAQLQKQAKSAAEAAEIGKPIGSNAPSIVNVIDKGSYKVVELGDGTFGMLVPSTGASKIGFSSLQGASLSGSKAAKKAAKGVLESQGMDPGSNAVDTLIELYEGRVRDAYGQAYREMSEKHAAIMERFAEKDAEMLAKLGNGEITKEQLASWRKSQSTFISAQSQVVDVLASDLHAANKRAMQMLNGYMMPAYAENHDFATFQIEQQAKISTSYSLYNRNSVAELIKNPDSQLLPEIEDAADLSWCRQKLASCITQSILQGESVPHAAERLRAVVGMGANSSVRAARTALTGAQNLGRLDAGRRAKAMGIELRKQWIATVDSRTRNSHRAIDRETVEIEEKFSNGCMYPGDPTAKGFEVWNCRCAMRYVLPGHEYDDIPSVTKEGQDYEEWKNAKKLKEQAEKDKIIAEIDDVNSRKTAILDALPDDKSYSSGEILKHPTSLSKWESEKSAIADSKKYCEEKLKKAKENAANSIGYTKAMNEGKAKHYAEKLAAIEDYDAKGMAYHEAKKAVQEQLDALDAKKKALGAKLAEINGSGGTFSQDRLAAGRRFATSREADDALRAISGKAWREATDAERRAIHNYTSNDYPKYNIPLGGYKGSYRNFVGMDQVDIGDLGRGEQIRDMTRMIERSITEEDMWLRRGVGSRTMSGFFGLDPTADLTKLSESDFQAFVGMSNRIGAFQSCGTTASTGFDKPVNLEIFVPKGSEAMYVEPISAFGRGDGVHWDGKSKQHSFGGELETIIQRGGSYTVTAIERKNGVLNITMELHPEDGYWKFQQ